MKKLLLGMVIGAAIASGIFYYIRLEEQSQQKEDLKALVESMQAEQAKNSQTSQTINDPNSAFIQSALTIVVGVTDEFYHYRNNDCNKIEKADLQTINELLKREKAQTKMEALMVIIKIADRSTYKNAIDLLDAITTVGIPPGHFAEVALSEREKICIQQYKKN